MKFMKKLFRLFFFMIVLNIINDAFSAARSASEKLTNEELYKKKLDECIEIQVLKNDFDSLEKKIREDKKPVDHIVKYHADLLSDIFVFEAGLREMGAHLNNLRERVLKISVFDRLRKL